MPYRKGRTEVPLVPVAVKHSTRRTREQRTRSLQSVVMSLEQVAERGLGGLSDCGGWAAAAHARRPARHLRELCRGHRPSLPELRPRGSGALTSSAAPCVVRLLVVQRGSGLRAGETPCIFLASRCNDGPRLRLLPPSADVIAAERYRLVISQICPIPPPSGSCQRRPQRGRLGRSHRLDLDFRMPLDEASWDCR